jgi:hypothetical protein
MDEYSGQAEYAKTVINLEEQYSVAFVGHNMVLTVIDGEICIAITSTSSAQVCNV